MTEAEDKTASLLAALWVKNRPMIEQRLMTLDRAAAEAAAGTLGADLRGEARMIVHKFSGGLGMYGYDEGTRIAREIEVLLEGAGPVGARLSGLVGELRAAIFPSG